MGAADQVLEQLEPVRAAYPDGGQLGALVTALMSPVEIVDEVVRSGDQPAWQSIRDPDTAPAAFLPWLQQQVGVPVMLGQSEANLRAAIRRAGGIRRGTDQAIIAAVVPTLTGSDPFVRVLRHVGGDRWALTLLTRTAQTPHPARTLAAALTQKPAGHVLTHVVSDAPIWAEATEPWSAVTATWAGATVGDVT